MASEHFEAIPPLLTLVAVLIGVIFSIPHLDGPTLIIDDQICSLYLAGTIVYNLYFHPLSAFPGPFLARSTLVRMNC